MQLAGEAQPLQPLYGYPGPFGAFSLGLLNDTATLPAPLALASPLNACGDVAAPAAAGAAAVVARGNCSFGDKAWALQKAGWGAMLLFNNEEGAMHLHAALAWGIGCWLFEGLGGTGRPACKQAMPAFALTAHPPATCTHPLPPALPPCPQSASSCRRRATKPRA